MPSLKARATEESILLRKHYDYLKTKIRMVEAKKLLQFKAQYPEETNPEIKARVDRDLTLYKLRLRLIIQEGKYRKKEVQAEGYDDSFTSAKRLAQLRIAELNNGVYIREEK